MNGSEGRHETDTGSPLSNFECVAMPASKSVLMIISVDLEPRNLLISGYLNRQEVCLSVIVAIREDYLNCAVKT